MRHGSCSPQTRRAATAPHSAVAELSVVRRRYPSSMNGAQTIPTPRAHRLRKHFFGASPALRAIALFSLACLLVGWVLFALIACGIHRDSFYPAIVGSALVAFVTGISSFCPFGGIVTLFATLTLFVVLFLSLCGMVGG
jgi:hypothetical protein